MDGPTGTSPVGGLIGAGLGSLVTYGYAERQGWTVDVPMTILGAAVATALIMGAIVSGHVYPLPVCSLACNGWRLLSSNNLCITVRTTASSQQTVLRWRT